ncbi:hypothetical protein ES288_A05G440600v1 [Gossypium darwinii]|uniref:Uncharacterized protein n=1 Tax=Gossypium darwinii TaxID=34276 RepID=A0A5D2GR45_GOSDA|nr:hypothetical protein ES288_A05G440600v1 [Gossypium darwinii]
MDLKSFQLLTTAVNNGYEVHPQNVVALNKIFQNYPHFVENFLLNYPEFQSNFMNIVAEIHQKFESNLDELELTKIDDMLLKVKDAEFIGLELSWLKEKLRKSHKKLKVETKIKMLEETIREASLELAKLRKKRRLD